LFWHNVRYSYWYSFRYETENTVDEETQFKIRENRRAAQRQRLKLVKSRRRDPRAYDFGRYWLIDPDNNTIEVGHPDFGMTLEEIEAALAEGVNR
jgi:hypothetical protein